MSAPTIGVRDGRFSTFVDADGEPPCQPPDDCEVCSLFVRQQAAESRGGWLARFSEIAARPSFWPPNRHYDRRAS